MQSRGHTGARGELRELLCAQRFAEAAEIDASWWAAYIKSGYAHSGFNLLLQRPNLESLIPMSTYLASFRPLLSSFINNFLKAEGNLICDCEAEFSLPAPGLVGLLGAEHPWLRSAPRGLPTQMVYDGQQRRQQ